MLCSFPYLGAINRTTDRSTLIFNSRRPILSISIFFQMFEVGEIFCLSKRFIYSETEDKNEDKEFKSFVARVR